MKIIKSAFEKSSSKISECPKGNLPEFALVGRSNVGKSSLINTLLNKKSIAKTSSKPGKTILINHFKINDKFYLVDLPGYGYARTSKQIIKEILTVNGIRFIFEDNSWGLVRASSNKPSLVIVTESPTSDERKLKIFRFIDKLLQETKKIGEYDQKI